MYLVPLRAAMLSLGWKSFPLLCDCLVTLLATSKFDLDINSPTSNQETKIFVIMECENDQPVVQSFLCELSFPQ